MFEGIIMRQAAILAIVLGIFSGQWALAGDLPKDYDPAETRCLGSNDAAIDDLLSLIDSVDKELPSVPPEEQHYLDTEYARALKLVNEEILKKEPATKGNQLFFDLSLRPYYDVWHLRRTMEPAKHALNRILKRQPHLEIGDADFITYNNNPDAEKLDRASHAIYAISEFTIEMSSYVAKKQSALTTEENNRFLATTSMTMDLGRFISCKLAKIMGRQKFN